VLTDAGRSSSRRPRQKQDCTVRALASARGLPYDEAYDLLAANGRQPGRGFRMETMLSKMPWAAKLSFPAKRGEARMCLSRFSESYTDGVYIVKMAKHVAAVINGTVYDEFENRPTRCVYTAWRITPPNQGPKG
jgi:hypothetical protein